MPGASLIWLLLSVSLELASAQQNFTYPLQVYQGDSMLFTWDADPTGPYWYVMLVEAGPDYSAPGWSYISPRLDQPADPQFTWNVSTPTYVTSLAVRAISDSSPLYFMGANTISVLPLDPIVSQSTQSVQSTASIASIYSASVSSTYTASLISTALVQSTAAGASAPAPLSSSTPESNTFAAISTDTTSSEPETSTQAPSSTHLSPSSSSGAAAMHTQPISTAVIVAASIGGAFMLAATLVAFICASRRRRKSQRLDLLKDEALPKWLNTNSVTGSNLQPFDAFVHEHPYLDRRFPAIHFTRSSLPRAHTSVSGESLASLRSSVVSKYSPAITIPPTLPPVQIQQRQRQRQHPRPPSYSTFIT